MNHAPSAPFVVRVSAGLTVIGVCIYAISVDNADPAPHRWAFATISLLLFAVIVSDDVTRHWVLRLASLVFRPREDSPDAVVTPPDDELVGVGEAGTPVLKRWFVAHEHRRGVLDVAGPAYLLDKNYRFLDWNPAFEKLVASPLGLQRGVHAKEFIDSLEGSLAVIRRANKVFRGVPPLVDIEPLSWRSPEYGLIRFRKIAAQMRVSTGTDVVWSVMLNIEAVEDERLWDDLQCTLRDSVNWSLYAIYYDTLLLSFEPYRALLRRVCELCGAAKTCLDLGAGTGNSSIALLNARKERSVWAIDDNESMLEQLRSKAKHEKLEKRLHIVKSSMANVGSLVDEQFDCVTMVNSYYALESPAECLKAVWRVLKPGGQLVVSTSHADTDLDALLDAIRAEVVDRSGDPAMAAAHEMARHRNESMRELINRDEKETIVATIEEAGFEIRSEESAYVDAVVLVVARRRLDDRPTLAGSLD